MQPCRGSHASLDRCPPPRVRLRELWVSIGLVADGTSYGGGEQGAVAVRAMASAALNRSDVRRRWAGRQLAWRAELRALQARQPRDAASGALLLSAEAAAALPPHALLDLRPYMDVGAATVREACPATQCFELFRRLGLRHLPVLGLGHEAVGVITRQELTTDFHVGSVLRASL